MKTFSKERAADAANAVSGPLATASMSSRQSSNRSFGMVIAAALVVIGCWPLIRGEPIRLWALVLGACFLVAALAWPQSLAKLNRWWSRLGILIGNIVSQLHIHVIGRKQTDPCWPGVVWGTSHRQAYDNDTINAYQSLVREKLGDRYTLTQFV